MIFFHDVTILVDRDTYHNIYYETAISKLAILFSINKIGNCVGYLFHLREVAYEFNNILIWNFFNIFPLFPGFKACIHGISQIWFLLAKWFFYISLAGFLHFISSNFKTLNLPERVWPRNNSFLTYQHW